MIQAVDMYYFLMDKHQNGKKHINPTFRSLCEQVGYHPLRPRRAHLRVQPGSPANSETVRLPYAR